MVLPICQFPIILVLLGFLLRIFAVLDSLSAMACWLAVALERVKGVTGETRVGGERDEDDRWDTKEKGDERK